MLTLALVCCAALSTVKATVPDQPVEVSLDLQGFERNDSGKASRAILFGSLSGKATISVLCEENDPFIASAECLERWKGATTFEVGDVACVEKTDKLRGGVTMTSWHAYVATADYLFDIHASVTSAKDAKFTRKDFTAIVESFATKGRAKAQERRYPDAYYAIRDEAATHPKDQLEWIQARCKERADDPLAHFYCARVLAHRRKNDLAAAEHALAADLLGPLASRSEQQTNVLLEALDAAAAFHGGKNAWREAIPLCERIVAATDKAPTARGKKFRASALYHLAIAHAQTKHADPAIDCLRRAIEIEAAFKERAPKDDLLEPLRSDPRFKKLTKS